MRWNSEVMLAWPNYFFWLLACLGASLPVAWLAVQWEQYRAPLVLFPLTVGALWGAVCLALLRLCSMGHRPGAVTGATLTALVLVCGQHYFHYRSRLETWTPAERAFAEMAGKSIDLPDGPREHLSQESRRGRPLPFGMVARGVWAWLSWAVDAAIVIGSAGIAVWLGTRGRYCRRCRSWYRTVRGGNLDRDSAAELARLCCMEGPPEGAVVRYRMSA